MRKLILTTAAVAAAIGLAGCGNSNPDTLNDKRDGQTYKIVKIGKQTWMAQNLNYQTKSGSWCYKDSVSYCKQYGRLYDWKTATTVCPKGWRLPSSEDWNRLVATADGKMLKSKSGWNNLDDDESGNGTDNYGFSALPGGYRYYGGDFRYAGNYSGWWTATEYISVSAYFRYMYYYYDYVGEDDVIKNLGFSVRCVKK
jgi:uncharacterized protein (TIGR02145 family)